MSSVCRATHEFCYFPCLSGTVAEVAVAGLGFVGGMQVGAEDLYDIVRPFTPDFLLHIIRRHGGRKSYSCTCNALAHKPVPSKEGRGSAIQWVPIHRRLLNGEGAEDSQSAAEDPGKVELAVGKDDGGLPTDRSIVLLRPALLKTNDLRRWREEGDGTTNFAESGTAMMRDEFQAQAVVGHDPEGG